MNRREVLILKAKFIIVLFCFIVCIGCAQKQVDDTNSAPVTTSSQEGVTSEQIIHTNISLEDEPSVEEEIDTVITKLRQLPEGFVYLDEALPDAQFDIRYHSNHNFVGEQVVGYNAPLAVGTKELAEALVKVNEALSELGYGIIIYDAYRPTKAVTFFKEWSKTDDHKMKEYFYPNEDKQNLFKRGYLASRSGHSRGGTIDLSLIYKDTKELVDMGSDYDMLDEISSFNTKMITTEQAENRQLLKKVMTTYGFKAYSKEWWHYVLVNEPYPKTYFDFDIE